MSGSPVLIDTKTVTTDSQAQLVLHSTRYTDATVTFKNPSDSQGVYRVVHGSQNYTNLTTVSTEVTFDANQTKAVICVGLSAGSGYNFYLQRKEFGSWIRQGDSIVVTTKKATDVNVSTSSKAAIVSWPKTHEASYTARLYDKAANTTQIVAPVATFNTSTNRYEATFTGLSNTKNYRISIQTVEKYINASNQYGNKWIIASTLEFTPSELANIEVDSVFASYVNLSWDDGEVGQDEADEEAEFRIYRKMSDNGQWIEIMSWTPDTTKTFVDTDLVPGTKYIYMLQRKGVDGVHVVQDSKEVTTKTTTLSAGSAWSTAIQWGWAEIYDSSVMQYGITVEGGETIYSGVAGTTIILRNLSPDTEHTLELFVVEKGERVLVDTSTKRTDKSGIVSLQQARYSTATFTIQNFSSRDTHYYIANEDESIKSSNISFSAGNSTKNVDLNGFNINSTSKIFLKRAESGRWVTQTSGEGILDHVVLTMKNITMSTSVASTSAMIQWDNGYDGAIYELSLFDNGDQEAVPIDVKANGDISSSEGKRIAILTDLEMETPYWGTITVTETNASGVDEKMVIQPFNFETSAGAVFQVGEVKASSAKLTWNAGNVEEEDGVAEFKVRKQEVSVGTWTDATNWLPHTTNSLATIYSLKPGTDYKFQLFRLGLDGSSVPQAIVDVTTKTSTLTISGTASSHIQAEWTELYPGAIYQLVYTADGSDPVTFGGGTTTATTALLTDLQSSTEYTVELYAIENGVPVGIATQALGSAASAKTGVSPIVVGGAVVAGAVVVGLVVFKLKAAKAASSLVA